MFQSSRVRKHMFPYGMRKNPDGTWILINRQYKPVGLITKEHIDYEDIKYTFKIKNFSLKNKNALSCTKDREENVIYFYNDGCIPESSAENMASYLNKIEILFKLR